jgi:predicted acylesterase/phospholipase RssA
MSSSDAGPEAIVLSGGGSYGAYEVGIVKALFTGASPATDFKPLNADMFVGTSAGAINAAVLVSHLSAGPSAAVQYLEHLWSNVIAEQPGGCGNGVYRVRTPLEFLDPDCLIMNPLQSLLDIASDTNFFARDWFNRAIMFASSRESLVRRTLQLVDLSTLVSTDPLHQRLAEAVPLEGLRQSDKILRVVTTNFTTGALQIFRACRKTPLRAMGASWPPSCLSLGAVLAVLPAPMPFLLTCRPVRDLASICSD